MQKIPESLILFGTCESVRAAMELSSIGDQVFAVESITKKRVRKVRGITPFNLNNLAVLNAKTVSVL